MANCALPPLYGLGKEQQNVSLSTSKQIFFFSLNTAVIQKSLLPFLLSPFPASSQPSFSGPCASCCLLAVFFPVLIFLFLSVDLVSAEEQSDDGHRSILAELCEHSDSLKHVCQDVTWIISLQLQLVLKY